MTPGRSAGVVLAAGASSRMGEPKQLLSVRGKPLLELVVAAATASRLDEVVVVLGAAADEIRRGVDLGRARVVVNPDHAAGMSGSLRVGVLALGDDVERAVIILGDQPGIDAALIDSLLETQEESGLPAAALQLGDVLHPPVVLARELWAELMALEGDVGCRRLIRGRPEMVATVPAVAAGGHPVDVDTPDDYRRLVESGG